MWLKTIVGVAVVGIVGFILTGITGWTPDDIAWWIMVALGFPCGLVIAWLATDKKEAP